MTKILRIFDDHLSFPPYILQQKTVLLLLNYLLIHRHPSISYNMARLYFYMLKIVSYCIAIVELKKITVSVPFHHFGYLNDLNF